MSTRVRYEKDANQNELYPTVNNKEQVVLGRYARDKDGIPFYPRDEDKNEFMDPYLGLIQRNGEYVYPKTFADGKPRYRDDPNDPNPNKRKIYEKIDGRFIIGRGLDGNEYYATDERYSDYYPEDNTPARKANGKIFYAREKNGRIRFPTDADGNEFYLTLVDPCNSDTIPDRYAKQNGKEMYPQIMLDDNLISDYVLNNTYIVRDKIKYYPKDAYNNEFYIDPEGINDATGKKFLPREIFLDTYAITNDGKVILPGINGKHHIESTKNPEIKESDILGKLVRGKTGASSDYLTKVQVSNKPTIEPKKYKYLDFKTNIYKTVTPPGIRAEITIPFFKTWYFWVLITLSLIIKSFTICWLFFKNRATVV